MKRQILLTFLFSLLGLLYAQTTQTFIAPAGIPLNFTVPCGVTSITVVTQGGGGGGAGDAINGGVSGGGGGGGGRSTGVLAVVPGQVIPYTIGVAGAAGGAGANGGNGGNSTFGGITANGGGGGNAAAGTGGAGGFGNVASGTAGANGTALLSGAGGNGGGGALGGAAIVNHGNGLPGGFQGGGGSGGVDNSGGTANGAAGGQGVIIITYIGPNAGPDQYLSCTNSTTMAANAPAAGTGTWSCISGCAGVTITNVNDPNTTVTGLAVPSVVVLRWTWNNGGPGCAIRTDDVVINAGICSDEPCSATPLAVNTSCTYSNFANSNSTASVAYGQPGCGNYTGNDMWYSAVVPANGTLTVQGLDAAGGTVMFPCLAIYAAPAGCGGALIHQGCSFSNTAGVPSVSTYVGTPGETVYIRVWDYNGTEGVYSLCAYTHTNMTGTIEDGDNTLTCAGAAETFTDPQGTGNYLNNTSSTYRICPDVPGQYVTVTFSSFSLETNFDYLTVIDGGLQNSPFIGTYTGTTLPPTITSSAPDGCLIFDFRSDATSAGGPWTGWNALVDCAGAPGVNTPFCSPTNCSGDCGTWICQDGLFPTFNAGSVGVQELNEQIAGCLGGVGEVSTQWFYFTALTAGSIGFSFAGPNGQNYDFAVWGPDSIAPCPMNTGLPPIRCSFADQNANPTGLANGAGDFYEGVEGDLFVEDLDVLPGQTYALVLNINQPGNPNPIIDLDITGTGTLDCTPLPIELLSFTGIHDQGYNRLRWETASEINNDYFTILYGNDAINYEPLAVHPGAGNSNIPIPYAYSHISPYAITYYKLRQTDYDGHSKEFGPISISKMSDGNTMVMNLYPNPANGSVNIYCDYEGSLTLNLIDNLGRVMATDRIMGPGINQFNLDGVPAGIYYLQVVSEKGIERIEKLIVQ